jgi:glycosyltransferase involved in cell wall biosynthesis
MQGEYGHDRKNMGVLVKNFFEAFKGSKKPKPALILKSSAGVASYISRQTILDKINKIRKTVNSNNLPNVYLITGEFSDVEMNELYNNPKIKAMVSYTKGEGFGRPLLEFSLTGKPVIASGWSGHLDFIKPDMSTLVNGSLENVHSSAANDWLIPEAQWFKIDENDGIRHLKDCFRKYKHYLNRSKLQKTFSKKNFGYKSMKEKIELICNNYIPNFPTQMNLNLPKMDKISLPQKPKNL